MIGEGKIARPGCVESNDFFKCLGALTPIKLLNSESEIGWLLCGEKRTGPPPPRTVGPIFPIFFAPIMTDHPSGSTLPRNLMEIFENSG
jgi:hypothetical protein